MADRAVQPFKIAADASRLTLVLIDHKNLRWLAGPAGIHDIDRAHALAGGFALAQLIGNHLVLGQRTHARQQVKVANRLGEKIVRPGAKTAQAIFALVQRRYKHDGDMLGTRIVLQLAARIDAVQPRHHDVHQDDVRLLGQRLLHAILAVHRRDDVEIFVLQLVGEQLPVLLDVVDDEDARAHLEDLRVEGGATLRVGWPPGPRGPVSFLTSLMKAPIWIGFDM